jgi:peptidoglycan/LPS O-acetylase OafA/YrhL
LLRSQVAASSHYRPEIDGLRAMAILPVLFYHAGFTLFSGGFVGVDVFFVISGFLITSIIIQPIEQRRFSFAGFYERRIRRIFPALFAVAFCSTIAAAILLPPDGFKQYGESLASMTVFASNIFFRMTAALFGYFDSHSDVQPLLHTWSLSVEEQFYIFLPVTLILLNRYARKHLVLVLVLACIASFGLSVWAVTYKPLGAFYHLPMRAWELLIGSVLAVQPLPLLRSRLLRETAGLLGLALIFGAAIGFNKQTPFPGAAALLPCVGAWLIIYTGAAGPSLAKTMLSTRPMVFIGAISYSLYLWHWPIIAFTKYFLVTSTLTGWQIGGVILASLIMAFISFEWIEAPFRRPGNFLTRRRAIAGGILVSAAFACIGIFIGLQHGFPQRFDPATQQLVTANAARIANHGAMNGDCDNWRKPINDVNDIQTCPLDIRAKNVLLWGDSHVEQLYPLFQQYQQSGLFGDHGVLFTIAANCPPSTLLNNAAPGYDCANFTRSAMQRASEPDIDTVFMAFSVWWALSDGHLCAAVDGKCIAVLDAATVQRLFIADLAQRVLNLRKLGKQVIVTLPFPLYDHSIPEVEIHNALFTRWGFPVTPRQVVPLEFRDRIRAAVTAAGATIFEPRDSLCDGPDCLYERDNVSLYVDDSHIANSQIGIISDQLRPILAAALGTAQQTHLTGE